MLRYLHVDSRNHDWPGRVSGVTLVSDWVVPSCCQNETKHRTTVATPASVSGQKHEIMEKG